MEEKANEEVEEEEEEDEVQVQVICLMILRGGEQACNINIVIVILKLFIINQTSSKFLTFQT